MLDDKRYAAVNDGRTYPPLTREDAHRFALKLLRAFGSPEDAAVRRPPYESKDRLPRRSELRDLYNIWTDGGKTGRRCWACTESTVGEHKGWGRMIHDVSHMIHRYRHPKARAHEHGHATIELEVMRYVEAQGWLVNEPMFADLLSRKCFPRAERRKRDNSHKLLAIQERITRWESKKRRAENALKKLRRRLA